MDLPGNKTKMVNSELVIMMTVMGLCSVAMAVLGPVMPLYLTSIGVNPAVLGLMLSMGMVGMVFGESSGGWLADKFGLGIPLSIGTFLCAPVVFAFSLSRSTTAIFLLFLIWGIFRAAIFGPSRGYIGTTTSFSHRATVMAIYAATMSFSRSIGTLMSGFIADNLGYSWNFYVSTGISIIAGILVAVKLRHASPRQPQSPASPSSPEVPPPVAATFGFRPFIIQCVVAMLSFLGIGSFSFLPLLATQVIGTQATGVGVLFTIGGLVTTALLIPFGRLADRKGKRALMISGLAISAIGLAGYATAQNYAWLVVATIVNSFGQAMFIPAAVALLSARVPFHRQNTAMGVYGACEDTGMIIGSAVSGLVWTAWGPPAPFLIGAVSSALGSVICYSLISEEIRKKK